ncbi:PHD and RING finger domain-containing protein 1 [Scleropages formosus]|uniref:PHD and ring finger domains 1 n=1 Tax=Scleropages formosus TaxID=113540 RepID=A0A8C9UY52_SCLFO|nr:PHD and RING finger domain-containing protein 1 [Scleropages formosus]XP_029108134.1 PHD and RING finger domain-containing protein 1 [Scleropages formosus]
MDEEDSQDELINRNASNGRGKRPASSVFTDEENDTDELGSSSEEESETDSGDGDEDNDGDEDEEDEEGDDSDDAEEDSGKAAEGAVRGALTTDAADLSSDEDAEKCPICLNSFQQQPLATPENCEHYFCLDCILEWSKNANSCPVDRIVFKNICLRRCYGGKVQKMITVQKPAKATPEQTEVDLDQTNCEVCGRSDREDRLLLCDGCDAGYHMECLTPPLNSVPVEEWFCPECAANNNPAGAFSEEVSEDELMALTADAVPTTSHLRTSSSRPTRAIARTRQSERVRATVNRNRITQARTMQHVPRYLVQSTWLDETIEAVVAGLNTAAYMRDLTPRSRTGRRRKTAKRRAKNKKVKTKGFSDAGRKDRTGGKGAKRRKRRSRKSRSRRKQEMKEITPRSRLAKSLRIGTPLRTSSIPSVYRPAEQSLGSMRADIGAASLSIYGDPFDLDPFEDEAEQAEQSPGPSHLLDAKRRGLSRSALRSHRPVARPVPVGLHRRGLGIPEVEAEAEAAAVPDLLGSILSSQSMLMMDSADVVINRDGSLKAIKPVGISSPKAMIPSGGVCQTTAEIQVGASPSSGTSAFHARGDAGQSGGFPVRPSPPFNFPSPSLGTPTSPQLSGSSPVPHPASPGNSRIPLNNPMTRSPCTPGNPLDHVSGGRSPNCSTLHTHCGPKEAAVPQEKVPPKPTWLDVSGLPRIPKIKRESPNGLAPGGNDGRSSGIPESCLNSLTGDRVRQQTAGQGLSGTEQGRVGGSDDRQRQGGEGTSSSFSSSFLSSGPPTGHTSSSAVSFRISSSGNSWHARRLAHARAQGADRPCKKLLDSEQTRGKDKPTKSEIYDPFEPTGSDSDSPTSTSEIETVDSHPQLGVLEEKRGQTSVAGSKQDDIKAITHQAISEPPDSDAEAEDSGSSVEINDTKHSAGLSDSLKKTCLSEESSSESPCFPEVWQTVVRGAKASRSDECSEPSQHPKREPHWTRSRSTSTSSHNSETSIKTEDKPYEVEGRRSQSRSKSKSPSSAVTDGKRESDERKTTEGRRSISSSPDSSRKTEPKGKGREKRTWCSHSKEHNWTGSPSDTESEDSDRSWKKRKRSWSWAKDRGRSRSSSKDRSKREILGRESHDRKGSDRSKDLKDKWHGQSRSRSRTRSRSGSKSRSRSRSRERRKDRIKSSSKSKDGSRSHSKDKRRPRSRSKSRERRKEICPSDSAHSTERTSPPLASCSAAVSQEVRQPKDTTVEKSVSHSTAKESEITKKKSVPHNMNVKGRDSKDIKVSPSKAKEAKEHKEIKKEKSAPLEMLGVAKKPKVFKNEKSLPLSLVREMKDPAEMKDEQVSQSTVKEEHPETLEEPVSHCVVEDVKGPKVKGEMCVKEEKSAAEIREQRPVSGGEASAYRKDDSAMIEMKMDNFTLQKIKPEPHWPEENTQLSCQSKMLSVQSQPAVAEDGHMGAMGTCSASPKNVLMAKVDLAALNAAGAAKPEEKTSADISINRDPFLGSLISIKTEKFELSEPRSGMKSCVTLGTSTQRPEGLPSLRDVKQEELSVSKLELPHVVQLEKQHVLKEEEQSFCKERTASAVSPQRLPAVKQELPPMLETTTEPAPVTVGAKSKPSVKRVTWNLKEADKLPCEKSGKLSHLKLGQSSRESSRRPTSMSQTAGQGTGQASNQTTSQDLPQGPAPITPVGEPTAHIIKKAVPASISHGTPPGCETQPGQSQSSQGAPAAKKKDATQNASQKDKYMKKLHMQERAVEEVKLAIKPFYQKRDITKDEYKDILRKAVQKVCHSKSGEINPVKVANLVKAYVDKYKHARKHKKGGDESKAQAPEKPKAMDNS